MYCGNNPVRFSDDEGTFWDIAIDVVFTIGSVINVIQNPTSGKAWAALGLDLICMVVPFVSGAGTALRVASKVDDVVDAGRAVNQVDNSIDVNKSIDIVTPTSNEKKCVSIISGYTRHGLAQAITRDGIGVTPKAILDAVNNPTKVTSKIDNFGRHSTQYKGRMATVVLNADMKIVSCWAKSSKYGRITKAND